MGKGSFLGEFEQVVLLAVARLDKRGGGYGVSIRREIEQRTARGVSVGSVYQTLARLEEKGFVRSWESDPEPKRGGRARKYFGIEPMGVRALQASRAMLDSMWDGVGFGTAPEQA